MAEQCIDVLRDVVVFSPLAEVFGVLLVVRHSRPSERRQLLRREVNERTG